MAEVLSGKISEARDAEVLIERPDGSRVTGVVNIRPLKNQGGEVTGAINCAYDITERKLAEQRQQFLMNELAHRGKNLLAVIQSIAFLSLSGTRPLAEARDVLIQRLHALARSQSALITEGFEGAPWPRSSDWSSKASPTVSRLLVRCDAEPQGSTDLRASYA